MVPDEVPPPAPSPVADPARATAAANRGPLAAPPGDAGSRAVAVAMVVALLYWILDLAVLRSGAPHPLDDLWEDALIAQSLLAGDGFRTTMLYPPLWGMRDPATLTIPVLVHGPLLPILIAPLFLLFGTGIVDHLAWLGAAGALGAAYCSGRLAHRAAGAGAAVVTVLLVTFSPVMLDAVHHSHSVALGAFALAAAMDALMREHPRGITAGLALGLGYLARPELMLAAPLLILGAGLHWSAAARFVAAFVACALPWWVHHALVAGSPFFNLSSYTLLSYSREHPGPSLMRDFALTPDRWSHLFRDEHRIVFGKALDSLPRAIGRLAVSPTPLTGWLMAAGLVAWLARPGFRRIAAALLLAGLIPVATMILTVPQRLYVVPFLPIYALAAAVGTRALGEWFGPKLPSGRVWAAVAIVLALTSAMPAVMVAMYEGRMGHQLLATERSALGPLRPDARVRPPEPMFSDRPDFVAWTTARPTFWVTELEYDALYPPDASAVERPAGLPARRDAYQTWFHDGHWQGGRRARP